MNFNLTKTKLSSTSTNQFKSTGIVTKFNLSNSIKQWLYNNRISIADAAKFVITIVAIVLFVACIVIINHPSNQ